MPCPKHIEIMVGRHVLVRQFADERVGTELPTVMEAGMLSVAITLGADSTLLLVVCSLAVSKARSWRGCPTRIPDVNDAPAAPTLPRNCVPVIPDALVPPFCCRYDSTPREKSPVKSTS